MNCHLLLGCLIGRGKEELQLKMFWLLPVGCSYPTSEILVLSDDLRLLIISHLLKKFIFEYNLSHLFYNITSFFLVFFNDLGHFFGVFILRLFSHLEQYSLVFMLLRKKNFLTVIWTFFHRLCFNNFRIPSIFKNSNNYFFIQILSREHSSYLLLLFLFFCFI
jgi:hypothetical protein